MTDGCADVCVGCGLMGGGVRVCVDACVVQGRGYDMTGGTDGMVDDRAVRKSRGRGRFACACACVCACVRACVSSNGVAVNSAGFFNDDEDGGAEQGVFRGMGMDMDMDVCRVCGLSRWQTQTHGEASAWCLLHALTSILQLCSEHLKLNQAGRQAHLTTAQASAERKVRVVTCFIAGVEYLRRIDGETVSAGDGQR